MADEKSHFNEPEARFRTEAPQVSERANPLPMGYFDGRQIVAETAIGVLVASLEEDQRRRLLENLEILRRELIADSIFPPGFVQGVRDAVKRLQSYAAPQKA